MRRIHLHSYGKCFENPERGERCVRTWRCTFKAQPIFKRTELIARPLHSSQEGRIAIHGDVR